VGHVRRIRQRGEREDRADEAVDPDAQERARREAAETVPEEPYTIKIGPFGRDLPVPLQPRVL